MPENKCHTVEEILTALRLCGPDYYNGACQKCPFAMECMPGENDVLVAEAERAMKAMLKAATEIRTRISRELEGSRVYIVIRRSHGERVESWIKEGRFRAGDYEKLGKTVFLRKPDAEKRLWRMQHGCE